ncbi:MAG: helix-turn-helix transcriptional regulator [Deltaproteobacteria bacterium]|nr:helix-turn-helix transcriptional regulator [Deltaproteobacteria bacterium]MBW1719858.1 helix-turn-helix transcriptional regulator [Deltaproteobacteria bacterium]MBW1938755.1 helix-turn-helix transcriptional regulator [Deltaproteobacteria bacterium]
MRTPTQDLIHRLKNTEYAKLYGSEDAKTSLAITLSKARHTLKMTQKQFAEKLEKSQPYIAKLESGAANPTIGAIGSMLAVVGLSLEIDTKALIPCISSLQQDQYVTLPKPLYVHVLSVQDDKAPEKIDHKPFLNSSSTSSRDATSENMVAY